MASPGLADRFDDLWIEGRELLEPAGITKPMFESLTLWSEGQYYLGFCNAHLPASDVSHWRYWWEKTVVPRSEVGKMFLAKGAQTYESGKSDGMAQAPTQGVCQAVLDSWMRDITAANNAAMGEGAGQSSIQD